MNVSIFDNEISESKVRVDEVFGAEGIVKDKYNEYIPRQSQLDAIPAVWDSFKNNTHCLLEGPCGFGKTFTYLFPSMMMSVEQNKRVIIATSGIALQDQLFKKDAPFMASVVKEYTGMSPKIGYLKGRGNYFCNRKCAEIMYEHREGGMVPDGILYLAEKGLSEYFSGDKDDLDFVPEYSVWSGICSSSETCENKKCEFYKNNECHYYKVKNRALGCNLLIVNYHILLSDIEIGGALLQEYDILVCDEAHELPDVIRGFVEEKVSKTVVDNVSRKLTYLERKYGDIIDTSITGIRHGVDTLRSSWVMFNERVKSGIASDIGDFLNINSFNESRLREANVLPFITKLEDIIKFCEMGMNDIDTHAFDEDEIDMCNKEYRDFIGILKRIKETTLMVCTGKNSKGDLIDSRTIRFLKNNTQKDDIELCTTLKKVDEYFEKHFISRQNCDVRLKLSIMLTSATISVNGNFNYIKEQLGISETYNTSEMIGSSPFDLYNQELWYLPPDAKDGNRPEFLEQMLNDLVNVCDATDGGVLGLFTSIYNMNQAYNAIDRRTFIAQKNTVMKQGMMPREKLVEVFRDEPNSILVGTKSLFTGIDVKGTSLRCVFIDKLPFPNINDPIQHALKEEEGYFYNHSIPSMIISLKQAVGRGVRTIDDKCVICIADNRMATARYKNRINESFPYKKRGTRDLDDVNQFILGIL